MDFGFERIIFLIAGWLLFVHAHPSTNKPKSRSGIARMNAIRTVSRTAGDGQMGFLALEARL